MFRIEAQDSPTTRRSARRRTLALALVLAIVPMGTPSTQAAGSGEPNLGSGSVHTGHTGHAGHAGHIHAQDGEIVLDAGSWSVGGSASTIDHVGEGAGPRVMIHAKKEVKESFLEKINKEFGTTTVTPVEIKDHDKKFKVKKQHVAVLEAPAGTDVDDLIARLLDHKYILAAAPAGTCAIADAAPFDNYIWSVQGPEQLDGQYGVELIALNTRKGRAHDRSRGKSIEVAVIDTGFDLDHPMLADHWMDHNKHLDLIDGDHVPEDEIDGIDNDGDGMADESYGHGTFVAGVVTLIAPDVEILPIRALDADGHASAFVLAQAIDYALNMKVDIINLSLTLPDESPLVDYQLERAIRRKVLVVAAAGNQGVGEASYPAANNCSLAVTAVDAKRKKSGFANYGEWVSLAAPGDRIVSAFPRTPRPDGEGDYLYAEWSGSSVATPFVSGVAALIKAIDKKLKPTQISNYLAMAAMQIDDLQDPLYVGGVGYGIPNAFDTLVAVEDELPLGDGLEVLPGCAQLEDEGE